MAKTQKEYPEIECGICGKWFKQTNKLQKYCEECRPNQHNLKIKYDKELARVAREWTEPEVQEYVCPWCNRHFKSIEKLTRKRRLDDGTLLHFCNKECYNAWEHDQNKCWACGKYLRASKWNKENENKDPEKYYCSPKCMKDDEARREEKKWAIARAEGWVHECLNCHKEFICATNKNAKFCSRDCHIAAVKAGYGKDKRKTGQKKIKRKMTCPICYKSWMVECVRGDAEWVSDKNYAGCCEEHQKMYEQALKKVEAQKARYESASDEIRAKYARLHGKQPAKTAKAVKAKKAESLCATCKIAYKNCERMTSNFTRSPEGASFTDGVITVCPKYKA